MDVYGNEHSIISNSRKQFIDLITALNNKVTKARELLLNDDIEPADFRAVRMEADREIIVLECKIKDLRSNIMSVGEIEKLLDSALKKFPAIEKAYCKLDLY